MKTPTSVATLEDLGRVRLSRNFYLREFLYSEVANFHGIPNIPDDPDMAIRAGTRLCEDLLEPLQATFGRIAIRSAFRSVAVNGFCAEEQRKGRKGYSCGGNEGNFARHIWDRRDAEGFIGATVSIVIPWFADRYNAGESWTKLAWWIHDHLPYSELCFFPKNAAFNISWREVPIRRITSYTAPKGLLTKPGLPNQDGNHATEYAGFPALAEL